jgi:hypothetical protein
MINLVHYGTEFKLMLNQKRAVALCKQPLLKWPVARPAGYLKINCMLLHLKIQSVPCSKHIPFRL